jgi:hypothetical protein
MELSQGWVFARGQTGWNGLEQEPEEWIESEFNTAAVQMEVPWISGCTLYLEGCDQSGGSFVVHKEVAAAGNTIVYLSRQAPAGAAEHLNNLLRWKVVGPGSPAPWQTCFRITVVFK